MIILTLKNIQLENGQKEVIYLNREKIYNHIEKCKYCFQLLTSINFIVEKHMEDLENAN